MQTCSTPLSSTDGVVTFTDGDTLSMPRPERSSVRIDGRAKPVGFQDARDRPKKRTPDEVAEQKAQARQRRDEQTERRVRYADEFVDCTDKGPLKANAFDDATKEAAENFGLVYRGVPAPKDSNQLQAIVRLGARITSRDRSIAEYAPTSWELMDRSAA